MAVSKSSRVNRKYKTKHKVQNWREYERGLRNRGDVGRPKGSGAKHKKPTGGGE